jgi:CRISPR-associated endonuclease Cas2
MRISYLVCYDICDDKRLRKVFQTMRNYGDHLQYSVFECQLTPWIWLDAEANWAPLFIIRRTRFCS